MYPTSFNLIPDGYTSNPFNRYRTKNCTSHSGPESPFIFLHSALLITDKEVKVAIEMPGVPKVFVIACNVRKLLT
jgi:hypothetical protein